VIEVGRSSANQPRGQRLLALIPLLAATSITLTITLPAAHRAPLGVVLFALSAACWLTVLFFARRLHDISTPSPPPVQPLPPLPPPLADQPSPTLHAAVVLARHGCSPQYIAKSLQLPLAFAELLAHHARDSHDSDTRRPSSGDR
jgi:hypothetical protein